MRTLQEKQRALQAAIENLYVEFSSYKLRAPVEGCPCCVKKSEQKRLVSKALRQLDNDDFSLYAFKSMTTWGDEYDYKHFLPRMFELLASAGGLSYGADLLVSKLPEAQWQTWPKCEKEAVNNYLLAVWSYVLAGGVTDDSDENWIACICQVVDDATPFLRIWEEDASSNSCEVLWKFINSFYARPVNFKIRDWLKSDRLLQLFEQRFFEAKHEEKVSAFAQVVDALTNFRYVAQIKENHETSNPN